MLPFPIINLQVADDESALDEEDAEEPLLHTLGGSVSSLSVTASIRSGGTESVRSRGRSRTPMLSRSNDSVMSRSRSAHLARTRNTNIYI